jgi:hypothetical protein
MRTIGTGGQETGGARIASEVFTYQPTFFARRGSG